MMDVRVINHGSLMMVYPLSEAAKAWVDEHIPDDAQWMGPGFAVEPRYIGAILDGMQADGLDLGGGDA